MIQSVGQQKEVDITGRLVCWVKAVDLSLYGGRDRPLLCRHFPAIQCKQLPWQLVNRADFVADSLAAGIAVMHLRL